MREGRKKEKKLRAREKTRMGERGHANVPQITTRGTWKKSTVKVTKTEESPTAEGELHKFTTGERGKGGFLLRK